MLDRLEALDRRLGLLLRSGDRRRGRISRRRCLGSRRALGGLVEFELEVRDVQIVLERVVERGAGRDRLLAQHRMLFDGRLGPTV